MASAVFACFALLLSLLAPAGVWAQPSVPSSSPPSRYEALLAALKKDPGGVDYTALRMAYADSGRYAPFQRDEKIRGEMYAALKAKEYAKALADAQAILKEDYVDIDAHVVAAEAYAGLKNLDRARYHGKITKGLIDSILQSGDGKSPETAYKVISVIEEEVVLADLHWKPVKQVTIEVRGHEYDRFDVLDPRTNQPQTIYFNVDLQTEWVKRNLPK